MAGVVTRNAEELAWPEFESGHYEVKSATGQVEDPHPGSTSLITCFADTAAAETAPELVAVDSEGREATADHPDLDAGRVCPTADPYREGLLETIEDAAGVTPNVRLDEVGFPGPDFCHCERCERRFAESEHEHRADWRASVVSEFVAAARERVPGNLLLTLHPDPYPGHVRRYSGVDPRALPADGFVVPLYDTTYDTTYWVESLAAGFADELDVPLAVELFAAEPPVENLSEAYRVAAKHADTVLFGYGSSNARAVLRRADAESRPGKSFGAE
jgi:hypothetical protein